MHSCAAIYLNGRCPAPEGGLTSERMSGNRSRVPAPGGADPWKSKPAMPRRQPGGRQTSLRNLFEHVHGRLATDHLMRTPAGLQFNADRRRSPARGARFASTQPLILAAKRDHNVHFGALAAHQPYASVMPPMLENLELAR